MADRLRRLLEHGSHRVTQWVGSSWAFGIAVTAVLAWAISGPFFGYSDTWQLIINTSTTVVTFLIVFLLQRSQNKDSQAIHIKLNEIVAVLEGASNRLIDVEDLSEDELNILHEHFQRLSEMARLESSLSKSHSVEEAEGAITRRRHGSKRSRAREGRDSQAHLGFGKCSRRYSMLVRDGVTPPDTRLRAARRLHFAVNRGDEGSWATSRIATSPHFVTPWRRRRDLVASPLLASRRRPDSIRNRSSSRSLPRDGVPRS